MESGFYKLFFPKQAVGEVLYLCTIAPLRVVVVLGGELAVCVFIRSYAVVVMLIVVYAQVQWVWRGERSVKASTIHRPFSPFLRADLKFKKKIIHPELVQI